MKIDLDRLLLSVVPLLFIISAAYYQGYWAAFDMDVYNYLDASDIVKGVGRPAFESAIATFFFAAGDLAKPFFKFLDEVIEKRIAKILIKSLSGLITYIIPSLVYVNFFQHDSAYKAMIAFVVCALASLIIIEYIDSITDSLSNNILKLYNLIVFSILLWPSYVYINGRSDAEAVLKNTKFNYCILENNFSPNKKIFKFLGKAGNYYFFMSLDNKYKTIINTEDMKRLSVIAYDISDQSTLNEFRLVIKQKPAHAILPASTQLVSPTTTSVVK